MKKKVFWICSIMLACMCCTSESSASGKNIQVHMRERVISGSDGHGFIIEKRNEVWNPRETAIIISDMWDKHWCDCATERVSELAPAMDEMLCVARAMGITIVRTLKISSLTIYI